MRLKLIACQVFTRELCAAIAASPNEVDVQWLPKGLHSIDSASMQERVQYCVDGVSAAAYDAVLLGYGLCNNGLANIVARELPLVLPRAHDCITLLLGSRRRYLEQFERQSGTYFLSSGWIERSTNSDELEQLSIERRNGMDLSYQQMVERYGEDNAQYLMETMGHARNYGRIAFIEMGVEPDDRFEREARSRAKDRGWAFDHLHGDPGLIQRLVDGPWDDDFLLIGPGQRIHPSYDEDIVRAGAAVNA